MLQQIQFHIHDNEQKQKEIERSQALTMQENYRLSVSAIDRFIPSLGKLIRSSQSAKFSLFCNKYNELNLVNYSSGQVLYGLHPKSEVLKHFTHYLQHSPSFSVKENPIEDEEALFVFGLGLGYHIEAAIELKTYKHIIVYEPNIDFFICSLTSLNWQSLLVTAKKHHIALYFQIGQDAANFAMDVKELVANTSVSNLSFYKHVHLPNFNDFEENMRKASWEELREWTPTNHVKNVSDSYLPLWTLLKDQKKLDDEYLDQERKRANLDALKHYFPELYHEFVDYTPQRWRPISDKCGEVYLYHRQTGALFAESPKTEAKTSFSAFSDKPNKDGLLLSYTGKKLKSYLHYQLMTECEDIFKGVEEAQSRLPEKVKSLIMFGLGNSYLLEALTKNHDVDMLFICEPDKDIFYASLFAVDWQYILKLFDEGNKRLYLNIGDDGTNLTNDIVVQFQSVGPYVLANTYIYQSYLNEKLTGAVSELREQLQVIIAMGDYFDNAKYGIAHTRWSLKNAIPYLVRTEHVDMAPALLDIPVFLVGNGPSLDGLIEIIKEERDKAIVVSCGTSIQALHRHGITPDFHAEIETNRSTFDWLSRVDDRDYLKQITLLSCNGIHPDSAKLFGRTLLAFKQGEAATVCLTELDKDHPFALLELAYPTVTNFAADLATTIGFTQIYLFGTDMGFVSETYHHSKSSGYYDEQGSELYSYAENNPMSMVIPGNFKPWVKTKYEFKISKSVLEQRFARSTSDVYNLSDGARIIGAQPLRPDSILLVNSKADKTKAIDFLHEHAFKSIHHHDFLDKFEARYDSDSLIKELNELSRLIDTTFSSLKDVDTFVNKQRDFIVTSYLRKKSLAFYYLNGTFNYINSMLSKLLNVVDKAVAIKTGNSLLRVWEKYIKDIILIVSNDQYGFDAVSSLSGARRFKVLSNIWRESPLCVESDPIELRQTSLTKLATCHAEISSRKVTLNWIRESGNVLVSPNACNIAEHFPEHSDIDINGISIVSPGNYQNPNHPLQANDLSKQDLALIALMSGLRNVLILQKYTQHPEMSLSFCEHLVSLAKTGHIYGGSDFIVISSTPLSNDQLSLVTGDRLIYMPRLKAADLRREFISQEEYERRKGALDKRILNSAGDKA